MKCIDPVLCYTIANGKKKIYRHFSVVSKCYPFRLTMPHIVFDCRTCDICRKKRARELATRCVLHASLYMHNSFLTLTYDEKNPEYHNNFEYSDIQKFKKRLRKHVWQEHKQRMEIFNVHEYGKNGKKHWHLIVFNYSPHQEVDKEGQRDCEIHSRSNGIGLYVSKTLSRLWPYGFSTVGDISEASAMYAAQYLEKDAINGNRNNSKKSHSKHSGIGRPWFLLNYKQIMQLGYIPINGRKEPVPRYFQKLAHKHWSHFNEKINFFDTKDRKALYRPFKEGQENKEISDLYLSFKQQKDIQVLELEKEWNGIVTTFLDDRTIEIDFQKSGSNYLYDLNNRQKLGDF